MYEGPHQAQSQGRALHKGFFPSCRAMSHLLFMMQRDHSKSNSGASGPRSGSGGRSGGQHPLTASPDSGSEAQVRAAAVRSSAAFKAAFDARASRIRDGSGSAGEERARDEAQGKGQPMSDAIKGGDPKTKMSLKYVAVQSPA